MASNMNTPLSEVERLKLQIEKESEAHISKLVCQFLEIVIWTERHSSLRKEDDVSL